jgi:ribosomal protein L21E
MDQVTIVRQLGQLAVDLDRAVTEMGRLEEIAVNAEGDFKVAFSRAFRGGTGSVEDRKQQAIELTDDLWRTWGKAAAAVRLQKEHIKALHARIDVGRTLQSTARAEMALAGQTGTP